MSNLSSEQQITLDLSVPTTKQLLVKQYDNKTRIIDVYFTDNGAKYYVPSGAKIYFKFLNSAKTPFMNEAFVSATGDYVTVTLTADMLESSGRAVGEIDFYKPNKDADDPEVLSTMTFEIIVIRSAASGKDIQSSTGYNVLNNLINKAETFESEAGVNAGIATEAATRAAASAANASTSEINAKTSETNAKDYSDKAKESEDNAKTSETNAKDYSDKAKESEDNAKTSETNAKESETKAKTSEDNAKTHETNAETHETNAKTHEDNSLNYYELSKSYAVGDSGKRSSEDTDNAKYYFNQVKSMTGGISGGLVPMGTVSFEELMGIVSISTGDMYAISNDFVTNSRFKCGEGISYPKGSYVYYTNDLYFDILPDVNSGVDIVYSRTQPTKQAEDGVWYQYY